MLTTIFLAIFLWSGPILVTEMVRRWKVCDARAAKYLTEARSLYSNAALLTAQSRQDEAAWCRERATHSMSYARKYRAALLKPWEFWALGEYDPGDFER